MTTANLFGFVEQGELTSPFASIPFAGADYVEDRDRVRLVRQIDCIVAVVIGGEQKMEARTR